MEQPELSSEVSRFLEIILSKLDANQPHRVSIKRHEKDNLAHFKIGGWERPIALSLAKELAKFVGDHEDSIVKLFGRRIMIADCVGPSWEREFIIMHIDPNSIE